VATNQKTPKGAFKAYTPFLPKELERIERWRFAKSIRSRADAVRALVMKLSGHGAPGACNLIRSRLPNPSFICEPSQEARGMAGGFLLLVPADAAQGLRRLGCGVPGSSRVLQPRTPISHPYVKIRRIDFQIGNIDCSETDDEGLDRIAKPFAETFLVSPIAMRIRLEKLALLHHEVPRQRVSTEGVSPAF
jgi:hypothetical protein